MLVALIISLIANGIFIVLNYVTIIEYYELNKKLAKD